MSNRDNLKRLAILSIETVFLAMKQAGNLTIKKKPVKKELDGFTVKLSSLRLRTFLASGTVCKHCGAEASFFAVEQYEDQLVPHLNLYGINSDGEMLFTCDHIIPLSRDGEDHIDNTQTLCERCNVKKSNKREEEL